MDISVPLNLCFLDYQCTNRDGHKCNFKRLLLDYQCTNTDGHKCTFKRLLLDYQCTNTDGHKCIFKPLLSRLSMYVDHLVIFVSIHIVVFVGFLAFDFCWFCVVIRYFHPRHNGRWPSIPDLSITFICLSLFLRKYFPFRLFSAKQGHYWGLNPGPTALEASTIPLGYRGGGTQITVLNRSIYISKYLCMNNVSFYKFTQMYSCIR